MDRDRAVAAADSPVAKRPEATAEVGGRAGAVLNMQRQAGNAATTLAVQRDWSDWFGGGEESAGGGAGAGAGGGYATETMGGGAGAGAGAAGQEEMGGGAGAGGYGGDMGQDEAAGMYGGDAGGGGVGYEEEEPVPATGGF